MTSVMESAYTLTVSRTFDAPRERVYNAWIDPNEMKRWMCPDPKVRCDIVTSDTRLGGRYKIVMRHEDGDEYIATGEYRELAPPSKIVFTWKWEDSPTEPGTSLVSVELAEMGTKTQLTLTHVKLSNEESVRRHTQGWTGCIESLGRYLGGVD